MSDKAYKIDRDGCSKIQNNVKALVPSLSVETKSAEGFAMSCQFYTNNKPLVFIHFDKSMSYEKPISRKNNKMDKGILFSALSMDDSLPKWTKPGATGMLKLPLGMSNFSEIDLLSPFHGMLSHRTAAFLIVDFILAKFSALKSSKLHGFEIFADILAPKIFPKVLKQTQKKKSITKEPMEKMPKFVSLVKSKMK